jgi:ribosome-binding protein aMBF1 (putative translation factor)
MPDSIQIDWCHTCLKMTPHQRDKKKNWICLKCKPAVEKKAIEKKIRSRAMFSNTKITADMASAILEKRLAGVSTRDLAKEYNVSVQTIQDHTRSFTATKAMVFKWIDERIAFHKGQ